MDIAVIPSISAILLDCAIIWEIQADKLRIGINPTHKSFNPAIAGTIASTMISTDKGPIYAVASFTEFAKADINTPNPTNTSNVETIITSNSNISGIVNGRVDTPISVGNDAIKPINVTVPERTATKDKAKILFY